MAKLLDPVCGMTVDDTALRAEGYDDVAFCAPGCRTTFLKDPDAYPDRLDTAPQGDEGGSGCGCGHGDHGGHGEHADHEGHGEHAGSTMELVETTAAADTGSGCCGGHGH